MSKLCIIPARGGSKRIPRKNIKLFFQKEMISYSIEEAKKSNLFDNIIVSTDDQEIADIAIKYGAQVPFIRPNHLSDDITGTIEVIQHGILTAEKIYNTQFQKICCLYATAPFIQEKYLVQSFVRLEKEKSDFSIPVTSFPFPIQRAVTIRNNLIVPFSQECMKARSQDLEEAYHDVGQFYFGTRHAWMHYNNIWDAKISPVILPRYLVQDIDTLEDWKQAEMLYQSLNHTHILKVPA